MESTAFEVEWLARSSLAHSLFTSAESSEVLSGDWDDIGEEFEGDSSGRGSADADVEEDSWVALHRRI